MSLDGYGEMTLKTKNGSDYWEIKIRKTDNPLNVTVTSVEGITQQYLVQ